MATDPTRQRGWEPPHCPNGRCPKHHRFTGPKPYILKGFYRRSSDRRYVQRYQCTTCKRLFSTQTFSVSYWLKRPDLSTRIFGLSVICGGLRQISRELKCSVETVCRRIARLGRHAMLWHWRTWNQAPPKGPIVIDGLRSFEYSQYHPIEHHVAVEADTSFVLYHTDSELRRMGTMTPYQKRRRRRLEEKLGRPDPESTRKDVAHLLETSLEKADRAVIHSDEHQSYRRPIRELPCQAEHHMTNSKKRRTAKNPLFEINLFDLLIRHAQANHKRETIAFSKRRQASAERLAILQVWRNYMNKRREKGPPESPAMLKNLTDRILSFGDVFRVRLFPGHSPLPWRWREYYERSITTREYLKNRSHRLGYAF